MSENLHSRDRKPSQGFLTIAYGSAHYKRMAQALLLSYKRFAPSSQFAVVSDEGNSPFLSEFDEIVEHQADFGSGLAQKLSVDKYSPFDETLFIDSDGLFYKDPEALWQIYRPQGGFGIRGFRYRSLEDGVPGLSDPAKTLSTLGISSVPFINSGIIYFRKSEEAERVFRRAREIATEHQRLGLLPFGGSAFNDENVWALAMATENVGMIPWSAGPAMDMYDHVSNQHGLDISKPSAQFTTYGREVDPIFVHYCAGAQHSFTYNREVLRLFAMGKAGPFKRVRLNIGAFMRTQIFNWTRRFRKRIRGFKIAA